MRLVRDRIDEIDWGYGNGNDDKIYLKKLPDGVDYHELLRSKFIEEVGELLLADRESGSDQVTDEAADVIEVLVTLAIQHGVSWDSIMERRLQKLGERGGFMTGLVYDPPHGR